MNLQCVRCAHVYAADPERDVINMYISDSDYDHILTKCPACGQTMRLFTTPDKIEQLIRMGVRGATYLEEPPRAIKSLGRRVGLGNAPPKPEPAKATADLPQVPREWLMQLFDDLRNFGSGQQCGD